MNPTFMVINDKRFKGPSLFRISLLDLSKKTMRSSDDNIINNTHLETLVNAMALELDLDASKKTSLGGTLINLHNTAICLKAITDLPEQKNKANDISNTFMNLSNSFGLAVNAIDEFLEKLPEGKKEKARTLLKKVQIGQEGEKDQCFGTFAQEFLPKTTAVYKENTFSNAPDYTETLLPLRKLKQLII